jgi:hypothetical protein
LTKASFGPLGRNQSSFRLPAQVEKARTSFPSIVHTQFTDFVCIIIEVPKEARNYLLYSLCRPPKLGKLFFFSNIDRNIQFM